MALTVRVLPPEAWDRVISDGVEPFATYGLPDPAHWRLVVAEQDGRIVGCSSLYNTVHNDWWIAEDAQRHPAVVRGLWRESARVLRAEGVRLLHATISDDHGEVQAMVQRLGYVPAPGRLFVVDVELCALTEPERAPVDQEKE